MRKRVLLVSLLLAMGAVRAEPLRYSGTLNDGGKPASGAYDVRLTLMDAKGNPLAPPVVLYAVTVAEGQFQAEVDFGLPLDRGHALRTEVQHQGGGFVALGTEPLTKTALGGACWEIDGNDDTDGFGIFLGNLTGVDTPNVLNVTNGATDLYLRNNGGIEQDVSTATGSSSVAFNASFSSGIRAAAFNTSSAAGPGSFTAGNGQTSAAHANSFVFADGSVGAFSSSAADQFAVRANGGFLVNTTSGQIDDDVIFRTKPTAGDAQMTTKFVTRSGKGVAQIVFDNNGDHLIVPLTVGAKTEIRSPLGVNRVAITNALEVEGNASKTAAGSWLANSDARIKTAIQPISDARGTLAKVRPVTFEYTAAFAAQHPTLAGRYYNVIAQEFQKVFPDAVKRSGEYVPGMAKTAANEVLQVDTYPALITAIAALQELDAEDHLLRAELSELRAMNATLMRRLAALEAQGESP